MIQLTRQIRLLACAFLCACLIGGVSHARAEIVGGPCEGCENVFVEMPEKMGSHSRIAPVDEPGEPLIIEGTVRNLDGDVAAGIIVYAYQTDASGVYPRGATRHGSLRGWAMTDENGYYRFDTIRPGPYPGSTIPQHVHMHVIEPDSVTYYIDDVIFDDDPLLTPANRRHYMDGRGGVGLSEPKKDRDGVWRVRRDITLGKNVPGYPTRRK